MEKCIFAWKTNHLETCFMSQEKKIMNDHIQNW